jgi:hypothetical protein
MVYFIGVKFFSKSALWFAFLLVLSSCGARQGLPASTVLKNAALASQNIDSVRYRLHAEIHEKSAANPWELKADIVGTLQSGGRVIQGEVTFDADIASSLMPVEGNGRARFVLEWGKEAFVMLDAFVGKPAGISSVFSDLLNQWWRISLSEENAGHAISSDPVLLKSQAGIVAVTREHGIVKTGGKEAYYYDVTLDPLSLRTYLRAHAAETGEAFDDASVDAFLAGYAVSGKLWIDVENFHTLRAVWDIRKAENSIALDMNFSDHNAAQAVSFPVESKPLSIDLLLKRIMGISVPQS